MQTYYQYQYNAQIGRFRHQPKGNKMFKWLFESAKERKFRKAREAKALRKLIEKDKKREAVDHPKY